MPAPMIAPLPVDMELDGGWTIRVTALDSTTGATVAGVTVSQVMIGAQSLGVGPVDDLSSGPFMLVPGPTV